MKKGQITVKQTFKQRPEAERKRHIQSAVNQYLKNKLAAAELDRPKMV